VRSDFPVIIVGEDGTGKKSLARAIHCRGRRDGGAFVPIPIGTLDPETKAEILFGPSNHLPSGEIRIGGGRVVDALGGALFLDRISGADECIRFVLPKAVEAANAAARRE
jgi:DNA-binding NtrC family response regulator